MILPKSYIESTFTIPHEKQGEDKSRGTEFEGGEDETLKDIFEGIEDLESLKVEDELKEIELERKKLEAQTMRLEKLKNEKKKKLEKEKMEKEKMEKEKHETEKFKENSERETREKNKIEEEKEKEKKKMVNDGAKETQTKKNSEFETCETGGGGKKRKLVKTSLVNNNISEPSSEFAGRKISRKRALTLIVSESESSESLEIEENSEDKDFKEGEEMYDEESLSEPEIKNIKREKEEGKPRGKHHKELSLRRHNRGRFFSIQSLEKFQCCEFLEYLRTQGWEKLFGEEENFCEAEFLEFYDNCVVEDGVVSSYVGGIDMEFDAHKLGAILKVPAKGSWTFVEKTPFRIMAREFTNTTIPREATEINHKDLSPSDCLLLLFVVNCLVPRFERKSGASIHDLQWMSIIKLNVKLSFPHVMINHIEKVLNHDTHCLPYGYLMTKIFRHFQVKIARRLECNKLTIVKDSDLLKMGFVKPSLIALVKVHFSRPSSDVPSDSEGEQGSDLAKRVVRIEKELKGIQATLQELLMIVKMYNVSPST